MEVIREKADMRAWSRRMRRDGKSLALVPTMGYLHEGHLSLAREARAHADVIVVSVYVNPGQFAPSEDLSTYPSDFQGDLRKLSQTGVVQALFCPRNLYDYDTPGPLSVPPRHRLSAGSGEEQAPVSCLEKERGGGTHETWVRVERLEKGMCGASRPVFFRGVATVVTKLFHIVEPDVAIFGKKDYQQWRIISRMVRDLDFAIEIIGSEIVREADGLAMSSRNVRLSPRDRKQALSINKALSEAKVHISKGSVSSQEIKDRIIQTVSDAGGRIDYVEIVEQESLEPVEKIEYLVVICIAAWFGDVRLIDNIEIDVPAV
ncbi:hypothetical protein LUZ63_004468 [Rhynchospora breviuscula]|uniref:Pantoate--beta-alanine ligase n=1 Tax=Rhynchospora breviuscula TaxID=2022672 RepID=A0A9Q0D552_9POAL|nr:hypothetical protein LUZ63_004468 [Rhynchospora breviuscula]